MKSGVHRLSLLLISLFIFSLALTGCVSSKQKFLNTMKAQGVEPLTSPEIKKFFSDATMLNSSGAGEYRGYYAKDGSIEVENWWIRAGTINRGKWEVSESGWLCQYFGGYTEEQHCYAVYPGKTKEEFNLVQMSGPISEYFPDGILQSKVTRGR